MFENWDAQHTVGAVLFVVVAPVYLFFIVRLAAYAFRSGWLKAYLDTYKDFNKTKEDK